MWTCSPSTAGRHGRQRIDLDDDSPLPGMLQTGAYPYADPVISDDGEMLLYLSDGTTEESRKDVTNTRVAFTKKEQGSFASAGDRFEGSAYVVADGYGDSGVKVAGADGSYAAAWVRQMENIVPESSSGTAGDALDEGQQMLQMNSTEIVAAIYEDGSWTLNPAHRKQHCRTWPLCGHQTAAAP